MSNTRADLCGLVIGDVMLDRRVEGTMTRISPEAPCPVLLTAGITDAPGGAANVAMNIATLGRNVQVLGLVGPDSAGQRLLELLKQPGIAPHLLAVDGGKTTAKTRITSDGQQICRLDDETTMTNDPALCRMLEEAAAAHPLGVIVVSDYLKGTMSPHVIAYVKHLAQQYNVPLLVDTKPAQFAAYACPQLVLLPNFREAAEGAAQCVHPGLAGPLANTDDQAAIIASYLQASLQANEVIITRGAAGATWASGYGYGHIPTISRHVYDVTGAGDTFLAAFAVSFMDGWDFGMAIVRANIAAGLAVQEPGVVAITRDAWEDERLRLGGYNAKHMTNTELIEFAARARRQGKRVVFTNGVFDVLHPGHLWMLDQARRQGDVLLVAYNDDASVKRLKGPTRPIFSQDWRGAYLAINAYVDAVTRFSEDTPEELIRKVKPDVLVKGQEAMQRFIPGADFVASHGGTVHFVPMLPEISTTHVATRLAEPQPP